ncbi:MAG: FkbM family methyltransferase [Vicinamibacterales bacterium]
MTTRCGTYVRASKRVGLFVLRSILERAGRRTVFRRRLLPDHGGAPIYVSGSAGLKYLFRPMNRIDPSLGSLAREFVQSRSVVWDVGANVGLFAFSAAHHAGPDGRVVAFEADAWLVQLLRRSAAIQPASAARVEVIPVAVASACDVRTFHLSSRSRATNSLSGYGSSDAGSVREEQTVPAISLDWFAERRPVPDVIKIDVEGAEVEVLTGACHVLEVKRPVVLCEVASRNSAAVTALLRDRGYRLYDADTPTASRTELEAAPWSTLAIG